MSTTSITYTSIKKVNGQVIEDIRDILAIEEPLEIRVEYGTKQNRLQKSISVTMRTPGNDAVLAIGFLFTEGIIKSFKDVEKCYAKFGKNENDICVVLTDECLFDIKKTERNFYTTSSCGVCGKASIAAINTVGNFLTIDDTIKIQASIIYLLSEKLRKQQDVFEQTGGLHACALFDLAGNLLLLKEDVGRHNALDKLVGTALKADLLPADKHILLLSGRASFELVQKAVMAGIKIIVAIGAPSSLAVEMAEEWEITLIGFLKGERFNIYSGAERIIV